MWIPGPLYESLPYLYILGGVLFISGTLYVGVTTPGGSLYVACGLSRDSQPDDVPRRPERPCVFHGVRPSIEHSRSGRFRKKRPRRRAGPREKERSAKIVKGVSLYASCPRGNEEYCGLGPVAGVVRAGQQPGYRGFEPARRVPLSP